jgi:hypothetical protein
MSEGASEQPAAKRRMVIIDGGASGKAKGKKVPAPGVPSLYDSEGRKRPQADVLLEIGSRHQLFRDPAGDAYAQLSSDGHLEVHAVESKTYREHLAGAYYAAAERGCSRAGLADAMDTLAARARFCGDVRGVWLRTARDVGALVLDTGDADWRTIRIDHAGWKVEAGGAVAFRRAHRMQALPAPSDPLVSNREAFNLLWKYANVTAADRVLVAAFILGAFKPEGPYPLLMVSGEQGTGKSTFSRLLKRLVDPSAAPLRQPPKEPRDVLVAAMNTWLLCLDNLSWLPPELSDTLCRISTGGAISERTLFSNLDETLVEVQRPVVMNGIEELATRPDLAQRGIHVELEPVTTVMPESRLMREFDADAPLIFGAILNALAICVTTHDNVKLTPMPRMADFAQWAYAGLPVLGFQPNDFMDAYQANQDAGLRLGLDSSPVGRAVVALLEARSEWNGTASELLEALAATGSGDQRSKQWPKTARALSAALTRLGPALRSSGIGKESGWAKRDRYIRLFHSS